MSNLPHPCDFVRNVFQLHQLPNNIRLSRWYNNMRLCRLVRKYHIRLYDHFFGAPMVSSVGKFNYYQTGKATEVNFNGHNAQFHALYEQHYKHGYEFETAVLLTRLLNGSKVFYDVGANWGYFSMLLAASPAFTGPIFAFEPNPETYHDLTNTIQQASLSKRITALNYGLGYQEGELHIEEPEKFKTGLTRLTANGLGRRVPVHTLDLLTLPQPDVIKIDAEGMEIDIFMGGEKMLRSQRPFLVFENTLCFDDPSRTLIPLALLQKMGYKLFNPALVFVFDSKPVLASYGDPLDQLLKYDPKPRTALIEITEENRFLMRQMLNVFACHETRLSGLSDTDFIRLAFDGKSR